MFDPTLTLIFDDVEGLREPSVLVLGVDDEHLDALVERSKDLELGEVALAGTRAGQDDLVVVLQGESIDENEPSGRGVSSQEDPAARFELGARERERGRERLRVEGPPEPQRVDAEGQRGEPALNGSEGNGARVKQERGAHGSHTVDLPLQRLLARRPDRDVEPDPEQPSFSPRELPGERGGVLGSGFHLRIGKPLLLRLDASRRLESGELSTEVASCLVVRDGIDMQSHIDGPRVREQRREPSR